MEVFPLPACFGLLLAQETLNRTYLFECRRGSTLVGVGLALALKLTFGRESPKVLPLGFVPGLEEGGSAFIQDVWCPIGPVWSIRFLLSLRLSLALTGQWGAF